MCVCVWTVWKDVKLLLPLNSILQGGRALWCYSVQRSYASKREVRADHPDVPATWSSLTWWSCWNNGHEGWFSFSQAVCFTIMQNGTSSFMTSAHDALVCVQVCVCVCWCYIDWRYLHTIDTEFSKAYILYSWPVKRLLFGFMPTSTQSFSAKVPRPPNVAFSCCSQQSEVVGIRFFIVRLYKCTEGRYPLVQNSGSIA